MRSTFDFTLDDQRNLINATGPLKIELEPSGDNFIDTLTYGKYIKQDKDYCYYIDQQAIIEVDLSELNILRKMLVYELTLRHFDIPGLKPRFSLQPETNVVKLDSIFKDGEFYISFSSIATYKIPLLEIDLYSDASGGLTIAAYGVTDKEKFFNCKKFHAQMDNEEDLYNNYSLRGTTFVHHGGDSREYPRHEKQPKEIDINEPLKKVKEYLEELVTEIQKLPIKTKPFTLSRPDEIPVKEEFQNIVTYSSTCRQTLIQNIRLINWSIRLDKSNHPQKEDFHDGFIYAHFKDDDQKLYRNQLGWQLGGYGANVKYDIKLQFANDVYVVDWAADEVLRDKFKEENPNALVYPDGLVDSFNLAIADTLVPINDYKGDYDMPVVVIRRDVNHTEYESFENFKDE